MRYQKSQIVKYSHPNPGEERFRFVVLEDNGDRVHVQLVCDYTIKPIETLSQDDIEAI